MNVFTARLPYVKTRVDILKYRTRESLLARLKDDMRANARRWTDEPNNIAVLRLPVLDFSKLSFAALKTLNGLHAMRHPRGSFSFPVSVRAFARDYANLTQRNARRGLAELADERLITQIADRNYLTHVRICDPGSGTPLDDIVSSVSQEFFEHDEAYWYQRLLGLRVTQPALDEFSHTFKTNCPFCSRAPRSSKERSKFSVHVTASPDSSGHCSSWMCHKCGRGGYCQELFLCLSPRLKRAESLAEKIVTSFPAKEEKNDNEIPF